MKIITRAYLFIYHVTDVAGTHHHCSVVSFGMRQDDAEAIAINLVHQQSLHIVATDTATPAPWLNAEQDGEHVVNAARFGAALEMLAA